MRKMILTSAGFDNPRISEVTISLLSEHISKCKILFITSAAETDDQFKMLSLCKQEILDLGVTEKQIDTYDFEYLLTPKEIVHYNLMYVAGGSTKKLLDKMCNWKETLDCFLDNQGLVVGVSAGSIAMTSTYENGLKYLDCNLSVHQAVGSIEGTVNFDAHRDLCLNDEQAILVMDEEITIFK